jgi:hypothetical protein
MMSITVYVHTGLRVLACGAVLALAGACQAEKMAGENQPLVTVKGTVVTEDGAPASDCKLEFYDTATVKPNYIWDVPADFSHRLQTAKVVKEFYFRVRCMGARVAARSRDPGRFGPGRLQAGPLYRLSQQAVGQLGRRRRDRGRIRAREGGRAFPVPPRMRRLFRTLQFAQAPGKLARRGRRPDRAGRDAGAEIIRPGG